MRTVEAVAVLLGAIVLFLWVALAHLTSEDRARLYDAMGESTGNAWR
jgi:hypothetical protein